MKKRTAEWYREKLIGIIVDHEWRAPYSVEIENWLSEDLRRELSELFRQNAERKVAEWEDQD